MILPLLLTASVMAASPSVSSKKCPKKSEKLWTVPPAVNGVPQGPVPSKWLPAITVVECEGTWFPHPADEAQAEMNDYCRKQMPALFARRMEAAERPWFGEGFRNGFLWGMGSTVVAVLVVVVAVSL